MRAKLRQLERAARRYLEASGGAAGPLVLFLSSEEYEKQKAEIDAAAGSRDVYIVPPWALPIVKDPGPAIFIMPRPGSADKEKAADPALKSPR